MAKLVLGKPPKSFKRVVSFVTIDGESLSIECTFKYRTRTEFGKFIDEVFSNTGESKENSMESLMSQTAEKSAEYLSKIILEWNLDFPSDMDSFKQLADECQPAVVAIMEAYRAGIIEGRLGN